MSTTEETTGAPRTRSYGARRVLAVVLVIAGIAWLPLNHDIEGPILFALDATHGVTTADLASVVMFLVARALFLSGVGPRRRARRAGPADRTEDETALSRT